MPPQAIALGIEVIEEAIKDAPALYAEFQKIFAKPNPVPADWMALKQTVLTESYRDFVPQTALPPQ